MNSPLGPIRPSLLIAAFLLLSAASRSQAQAPTVTTGPATWATSATATLTGTVNPNGFATTARFEYGATTAYGTTKTVTLSPNNGSTALNVAADHGTLPVGTTYHYRLTATNASGTTTGEDRVFITERVSGDYKYTTVDITATITGYTGAGGAVSIPDTGRWAVGDRHRLPGILQQDGHHLRGHSKRRHQHRQLCIPIMHWTDEREHPRQHHQHRQ